MRKSRFTEEQIIGFIKQAESGLPIKDLCRKGGFSDATFYKWRAKYGSIDVPDSGRRAIRPRQWADRFADQTHARPDNQDAPIRQVILMQLNAGPYAKVCRALGLPKSTVVGKFALLASVSIDQATARCIGAWRHRHFLDIQCCHREFSEVLRFASLRNTIRTHFYQHPGT